MGQPQAVVGLVCRGKELDKLVPKRVAVTRHPGGELSQRVTGADAQGEAAACPRSRTSQQDTQAGLRPQHKPQGEVCARVYAHRCGHVRACVRVCLWCAHKERHLSMTPNILPSGFVQTSPSFCGSRPISEVVPTF